jgi:hypothetical protein
MEGRPTRSVGFVGISAVRQRRPGGGEIVLESRVVEACPPVTIRLHVQILRDDHLQRKLSGWFVHKGLSRTKAACLEIASVDYPFTRLRAEPP